MSDAVEVKIPEKVKIGPYEIKVELVKDLLMTRNRTGEYSPSKLTISLDENWKRYGETLMHEIVEAIDEIYDLNLDHHVISLLGIALYQVLKENKITF